MINDAIARAGRNTLSDGIRRAAARFRDRQALVFGDRTWTFRGDRPLPPAASPTV